MPSPGQRLAPGKSDDHRAISVGPKEVALRKNLPWGGSVLLVLTALEIKDFMFHTPLSSGRGTPSSRTAPPKPGYQLVPSGGFESTEADTAQDRDKPFLPRGC